MRFFARILSFFLIFSLLTNIFSIPIFAAENQNAIISSVLPNTQPGVPQDINTLTQGVIMGMISFATCALAGINVTQGNQKCLGYAKDGRIGYTDNSTGLAGLLVDGIALTFTKPMGTSDYIRYLSSNFSLVKHAYAANTGFDQLSPLTNIWIGMRNFTYVLFVIVFVVIGFAIMLRAKIDPRTAMTVENQIPKLIIALLLISFSFAIAGLMVDIMWVLIFVTINLFVSLDPGQLNTQLSSITSQVSGSPFDLANSVTGAGGFLGIAGQAANGVGQISQAIVVSFFQTTIGEVIKYILVFFEPQGIISLIGCAIGQATGNLPVIGWFTGSKDLGTCIDNAVASQIAGLGATIAFLIFTIAIIIALAKLWWQLIKSYSLFIIYVILAPPFILLGALPGSKINFENWLRHIAAYLFVFPTAAGILLMGKLVMDAYGGHVNTVPPLLGIPTSASGALGSVLGFAIIMLLPQSLTIVQDALQAPDMKYLPGVGAALAGGTQAVTGLGMQQVRRAFRAKNLVEGIDEGWARRAIPPRLKRLFYGKPVPPQQGAGSGHGQP